MCPSCYPLSHGLALDLEDSIHDGLGHLNAAVSTYPAPRRSLWVAVSARNRDSRLAASVSAAVEPSVVTAGGASIFTWHYGSPPEERGPSAPPPVREKSRR